MSASTFQQNPNCYPIVSTGHAFEARIYAENVPKGFLPAAGILYHYQPVSVSPTGKMFVYFSYEGIAYTMPRHR